jgi:type II secretory ATPase GspE/PulE/Tfp pilus assembly ATPase PilB-like protein
MRDLPIASLADFSPLPEGSAQYSLAFIEAQGAIKLREKDGELLIGLKAEADAAIADTLANYHRRLKVGFRAVDASELAAYLGSKGAEGLPAGEGARGGAGRIALDRHESDAPIVNLVNSLCIEGIRCGASDIHIEAQSEAVRVRHRIDGFLRTARSLDLGRFAAVSSRIKIMAGLDIMESRLPQDGRMSVDIGDYRVDLRVSVVPVASGESIVLRIFNGSSSPLAIDALGFDPRQLLVARGMLKRTNGLVLVTGPTGSGKTTTLNAMLRILSSDSLKIITIEDPIEYLLEGVNQIQTNERIKLGFDTILRRVLRQDPNVIMVGEIRDQATAELAIRAALTGHLVLSTLHAKDCVSAVARLRDLGVEPYLLASVLQGTLAQRLVRRICPSCARSREPDPAELRLLKKYALGPRALSYGAGCEDCAGTGFRGRMVISESFAMDRDLEEAISRDEGSARLRALLGRRGSATIADDGMAKAAAGATTISEIEREVAL